MLSEQLSPRKMTTDRQELRGKNNGSQWEFVKVRIEGQISLGGWQTHGRASSGQTAEFSPESDPIRVFVCAKQAGRGLALQIHEWFHICEEILQFLHARHLQRIGYSMLTDRRTSADPLL